MKNFQECPERHEHLADDSRLLVAGFTTEERERLQRLKRAVRRGERSDAYPVDRRQDFIRWLVEHGKLSDN